MKKIAIILAALAASSVDAFAADMAVKAPPAPPAALYNWTGFYIGGNSGYGWGGNTSPNISFTDPGNTIGFANYFALGGNVFPALKPRGFIGGGRIGWGWQWGQFVGGVGAAILGPDIKASGTETVAPPVPGGGPGFQVTSTQTMTQKLEYLGTERVRAGFAANNWLFYGTGGFAYGHVTSSMNFSAPGGPVFLANSNTQNLFGWVAGAGVNYGIANWGLGLEWLHYDLGRSNVTAFPVA